MLADITGPSTSEEIVPWIVGILSLAVIAQFKMIWDIKQSEAACRVRVATLMGEVRRLKEALEGSGIKMKKRKSSPNLESLRDDDEDHSSSNIHK